MLRLRPASAMGQRARIRKALRAHPSRLGRYDGTGFMIVNASSSASDHGLK